MNQALRGRAILGEKKIPEWKRREMLAEQDGKTVEERVIAEIHRKFMNDCAADVMEWREIQELARGVELAASDEVCRVCSMIWPNMARRGRGLVRIEKIIKRADGAEIARLSGWTICAGCNGYGFCIKY